MLESPHHWWQAEQGHVAPPTARRHGAGTGSAGQVMVRATQSGSVVYSSVSVPPSSNVAGIYTGHMAHTEKGCHGIHIQVVVAAEVCGGCRISRGRTCMVELHRRIRPGGETVRPSRVHW